MTPEETIAKLTETLPTVKTQAGCEKCLDRAFELLNAWFIGKELDAAPWNNLVLMHVTARKSELLRK